MSETAVKHASNAKRLGAFAIDAGISIVLGLLIFLFLGERVIMEQGHYYENISNAFLMLERSGLAKATPSQYSEGQYTAVEFHLPKADNEYNAVNSDGTFGYKNYEDDLVYFFSTFMPSVPEYGYNIKDSEKYNLSYFNKEWLGLSLTADENGLYGNQYYQPGKDESDNLSLNVRPILLPSVEADLANDEKKEATAKALYKLYYEDTSVECLYYKAALLVVESETYQTFYGDAKTVFTLAEVPTLLIPPLVFFVIIPLCKKDGETLGKRILHLCLLSKDESAVKRWQVAVHGLIFVIIPAAFLLPLDVGMIFMAIFLFVAIDMMTLMVNKNGQALEDRLAGTIVIDKSISSWGCAPEEKKEEESEKTDVDETKVVDVEAKDKEAEQDQQS